MSCDHITNEDFKKGNVKCRIFHYIFGDDEFLNIDYKFGYFKI